MGICLNMIVKNEAGNLPRLFASLSGQVDFYVISDTGSSDDTIEVIHRLGKETGIPGIVTSHHWVDFAHNRNLVLQEAINARLEGKHDCDWLMIIDADEELAVEDEAWRSYLQPGCSYSVRTKSERISVARTFLLWTPDVQWRWQGKTHNYLTHGEEGHPVIPLEAVHIVYHEFEGAKSHAFADGKEKAGSDIRLLEDELEGVMVARQNAHRFFQLGYAYWNVGDPLAAIGCMRKVADCPDAGNGKKYAALLMAAKCGIILEYPSEILLRDLDMAISLDAARWEAPYYKAVILRKNGDPEQALDILMRLQRNGSQGNVRFFREDEIYDWRMEHELAFLLFLTGDRVRSLSVIEASLSGARVPEAERAFMAALRSRITGGDTSPTEPGDSP
jgi:glycosyltransferase involved in cell wall biosynthesis